MYDTHLYDTFRALTTFRLRGRSDFSVRELTGRSGKQQREVGRLLGEVDVD